MNSFLNYLLQSALTITVLYLVFRVLFERLASFTFNRFFLLGSVLFALVIPLLHVPVATSVGSLPIPGASGFYQLPEIAIGSAAQSFSDTQILICIYGLGALLLLLRLLRQLRRIVQLKKNSLVSEQHQGYTLVYTDQQNPAFTFGRTIFLSNSGNFSPAEKEIMLAHELVHVKQRHTLDILLLEVVIIFQWFNPFVWLLKSSLRDQHEFLADQAGVRAAPDFKFYTRQIIGQVLNVSPSALTHNFSSSQLKKRMIMMQQKTTLRSVIARAALALPIAGILFYTISCDNARQEITPAQTHTAPGAPGAEKVMPEVDEMPAYKGGQEALFKYLADNIKYPEISKAQEGKVIASFIVGADGQIRDIKILRSMGEPFDSEVIKVLKAMPAWNPAMKDGKAVPMQLVVPVAFKSQSISGSAHNTTYRNDGILFRGFESTLGGC